MLPLWACLKCFFTMPESAASIIDYKCPDCGAPLSELEPPPPGEPGLLALPARGIFAVQN